MSLKFSTPKDDSSLKDKAKIQDGLAVANRFLDFPVLTENTRKDESVRFSALQTFKSGRKVAVFFQEGATLPEQWKCDGGDKALTCWKSIPGAAGCGSQLKKLIELQQSYEDNGYSILLIVSHKTSEELKALIESTRKTHTDYYKGKKSLFEIVAITPEGVKMLANAGFPNFSIEQAGLTRKDGSTISPSSTKEEDEPMIAGNQALKKFFKQDLLFLKRFTFLLSEKDRIISKCFDRSMLTFKNANDFNEIENEPESTLKELSALNKAKAEHADAEADGIAVGSPTGAILGTSPVRKTGLVT